MKENSINELTHHGVKGMKWGKRKKPSNIITKAIRTDIDDIKNDINNYKNRYKNVVSGIKNAKKNNISRYRAYKNAMDKSYRTEENQRVKTLKNRVDRDGYKSSTIINTSKHAASVIGSLSVAKYLVKMGGTTIKENWDNPYISKGRKAAAIMLVGGIASIPISSALKEIKIAKDENEIQRKHYMKQKKVK